eukprot:7073384-Prorocentrum_lima.AAC.1
MAKGYDSPADKGSRRSSKEARRGEGARKRRKRSKVCITRKRAANTEGWTKAFVQQGGGGQRPQT